MRTFLETLKTIVPEGKSIRVHIEAKRHNYHLVLNENYLGGSMTDKENYRGRDLADGKPDDATLDRFLHDVIEHELDD